MMRQFRSIKEQYPDALLLFRCGDFYETYAEDAVRAAKILNITLTKRNNGGGAVDSTAMAGFPFHALDTYLPKLVRAGMRVAICDQLEDPKLAKGLVQRGVTELVMLVYLGKVHAATVFAGAFRDPEFDLSRFPVSYRKKYQQLPVWDDARIPQLEQVLISASYSLLLLAANIRERYVSEPGRTGQIHRFFLYHFKEHVGVSDLAKELNLSESRTVHLLKELFGKGFAELMNEERVRQAEEYLAKTDLPLREIARLTGFRNEYYLSYVFRRIRHCSPGSIRSGRKKKILEA